MEKWTKIEEFLNQFIQKVTEFFRKTLLSLTPSKVKKGLSQTQEKLKTGKGELKTKLSSKVVNFQEKAKKRATQVKSKVKSAKEKSGQLQKQVRQVRLKDANIKKMSIALIALFTPAVTKISGWLSSLKPITIVGIVSASAVGSLAGLNIYKKSKEIASKSKEIAAKAELVEEVKNGTVASRRPAYFKRAEKQFRVSNISLPAYFDQKKGLRKLVIDFSFESSNKYIKAYLWENPHLVQDVLNSKIEPITLDFPLQDEGKIIIRDKIRREMNVLLKKIHIQGEIKEVRIHSLVGG